jgi:hypothetical protein
MQINILSDYLHKARANLYRLHPQLLSMDLTDPFQVTAFHSLSIEWQCGSGGNKWSQQCPALGELRAIIAKSLHQVNKSLCENYVTPFPF